MVLRAAVCTGTDPAGISTSRNVRRNKHCNETDLFNVGWRVGRDRWWHGGTKPGRTSSRYGKDLPPPWDITGMLPSQNHSGWHLMEENSQAKAEKDGPSTELEGGISKGEAHPNTRLSR